MIVEHVRASVATDESRSRGARRTPGVTARIALLALVSLGCGTAAPQRRATAATAATAAEAPAATPSTVAPATPAAHGTVLEVARADTDADGVEPSVAATPRDPTRLDAPPFVATVVDAVPVPDPGPTPRLVRVSEARNKITDQAEWFTRNGLAPLGFGATDAPAHVPAPYVTDALSFGISHADHTVLAFGGRHLIVLDHDGKVASFLDFESYVRGPHDVPADADFTEQEITWAVVREGVLYVSHAHRTYAKSSGGLNAYVTALDLATGRLRWRSAPLVANAGNFIIHAGYLVTGYGFTAEPDWLYVLNSATGAIVSRTKVRSGPEAIIEKDNRLYVRTYDMDYVFEFRGATVLR